MVGGSAGWREGGSGKVTLKWLRRTDSRCVCVCLCAIVYTIIFSDLNENVQQSLNKSWEKFLKQRNKKMSYRFQYKLVSNWKRLRCSFLGESNAGDKNEAFFAEWFRQTFQRISSDRSTKVLPRSEWTDASYIRRKILTRHNNAAVISHNSSISSFNYFVEPQHKQSANEIAWKCALFPLIFPTLLRLASFEAG